MSPNTPSPTAPHFTLTQVVGENLAATDSPPSLRFAATRRVLGRSDRSDLQVATPSVSRQHAAIWLAGDTPMIEDLGSAHGTLVNARRISQATALRAGDLVALGAEVVLLVAVSEQGAEAEDSRSLDENAGGSPLIELAQGEGGSHARLAAQAEALATIVALAEQAQDGDALLGKSVAPIQAAIGAEVLLVLWGEQADALRLVARSAAPATGLVADAGPSHGILRRALLAEHAVVSFDAQLDQRFRHRQSVELRNIRSAVCATLRCGERRYGLLYADTSAVAGLFSPADGRFLELAGRCLAARLRQLELERELQLLQHRRHDTAFRSEELMSNLDLTLRSHLNRLELIADEAAVEEQRPQLALLLRAESERLRADIDGVVCWSDAAVTRQVDASALPNASPLAPAPTAVATRVEQPRDGQPVAETPTGEFADGALAAPPRRRD